MRKNKTEKIVSALERLAAINKELIIAALFIILFGGEITSFIKEVLSV
jgi:hypothetical protein